MKQFFASAFAALSIVTASLAFAGGDLTYFSANLKFSELTVIDKDGKTITYDVAPALAAAVSFDSTLSSLEFGAQSRCLQPLLGTTATELKIEASNVIGTHVTQGPDGERLMGRTSKTASAVITVPKGSEVYGICSGSTKTLVSFSIYAKEKTSLGFERK